MPLATMNNALFDTHHHSNAFRRIAVGGLAFALAAAPCIDAQAGAQTRAVARGAITVRWLGHAAFEVTSAGGTRLLVDPFISGNPTTPDSLKDLARYGGLWKPQAILVTHSHADHALDAKAIAQSSGAPVISAYEWVATLKLPEAQTMGGNVGGHIKVGDVIVHLVPAMHSSDPGGRPLGFVLEFADHRTLYHTGDTWLFGDMALIQERFHPSIILLGVGGGPFTEDPQTAAMAIRKFFAPTTIVPMHYATFPGLASEAEVRAAFAKDRRLVVMTPGQTRQF
ncbi:MAG: metal-dependent hydrolase [Gemmatimonadaceae bacterium]